MSNSAHDLSRSGQSLWLDSITRAMVRGDGLRALQAQCALSGLTSNPTIFEQAIRGGRDYDAAIRAGGGQSPEQVFFDLAIEDLRGAAAVFAPIHQRTRGVDGWVSLEVSPLLADDAETTIAQALELHRRAALPNLFIKVPGTAAGVRAIEELIFRGVPINVTLLFSPEQYQAAAEAYLRGLERRLQAGLDLDVASVASVFISRWDVKVAGQVPADLRNRLGLAVAGEIYARYRALLDTPRLQRLQNFGARPQRLLWASTGTKDPQASDVLYVENLIAPLTVNTLPEATLRAYADHGRMRAPMAAQDAARAALLQRFTALGLAVEPLGATLQREGAAAFVKSWNALLESIAQRQGAAA